MNAMDLFSAGSETTATTLAWAVRGIFYLVLSRLVRWEEYLFAGILGYITHCQVNYMLLHPEVQTKVQEEVDQVQPPLKLTASSSFLTPETDGI